MFGFKRKSRTPDEGAQVAQKTYLYNLVEGDGTIVRHFSVTASSDAEAEDLAFQVSVTAHAGYSFQYLASY